MKLKPGEIICSQCEGKCFDGTDKTRFCRKCHGTGKLDWIENIVGKRPFEIGWEPMEAITNEWAKRFKEQIDIEICERIHISKKSL